MIYKTKQQLGHLRRMIDGFHRETPACELANVARQLNRIETLLADDGDKYDWDLVLPLDQERNKLMLRLYEMIGEQAFRELAAETTTEKVTTR